MQSPQTGRVVTRHLVHRQLRRLALLGGHGKENCFSAAPTGRCGRPPRLDVGQPAVVVRVVLPNHRDHPVAARDVRPLARPVKAEVVGVPARSDTRNHLAGLRVEDEHDRRPAAADEQAVARFVQRERVIPLAVVQLPRGDDLHRPSIDHRHLPDTRRVHEDAGAALLDLQPLRLGRELHLPQHLALPGGRSRQSRGCRGPSPRRTGALSRGSYRSSSTARPSSILPSSANESPS